VNNLDKSDIIKFRQKYRSIGSIKCPAFSGEQVFFGRSGFNHLIRKGRKLRKSDEQIDRLELLSFAPYIIHVSKSFYGHRKVRDKVNPEKLIKFWSFVRYGLLDRKITVIVRQSGNGKKEFYSIFI
jgi:hypothetical protein